MNLEAVSEKTKAAKIGETWYHCSDAVLGYLKTVPKGSEVEVTGSEKQGDNILVTRVQVLKKASTFAPKPQYSPSAPIDNDSGKYRSMTLSYAKDLVVAGKLELSQMLNMAKQLDKYLENGIIEEDMR